MYGAAIIQTVNSFYSLVFTLAEAQLLFVFYIFICFFFVHVYLAYSFIWFVSSADATYVKFLHKTGIFERYSVFNFFFGFCFFLYWISYLFIPFFIYFDLFSILYSSWVFFFLICCNTVMVLLCLRNLLEISIEFSVTFIFYFFIFIVLFFNLFLIWFYLETTIKLFGFFFYILSVIFGFFLLFKPYTSVELKNKFVNMDIVVNSRQSQRKR